MTSWATSASSWCERPRTGPSPVSGAAGRGARGPALSRPHLPRPRSQSCASCRSSSCPTCRSPACTAPSSGSSCAKGERRRCAAWPRSPCPPTATVGTPGSALALQRLHWKGLSPEWMRPWRLRLGFSPVCTRWCRFRLSRCAEA
uniref:Uncharacterized protein n=1 Tax=Nothoprocta perdicaria TaxID=30464 RepID=A0A8C7A3Z1_NOTPE